MQVIADLTACSGWRVLEAAGTELATMLRRGFAPADLGPLLTSASARESEEAHAALAAAENFVEVPLTKAREEKTHPSSSDPPDTSESVVIRAKETPECATSRQRLRGAVVASQVCFDARRASVTGRSSTFTTRGPRESIVERLAAARLGCSSRSTPGGGAETRQCARGAVAGKTLIWMDEGTNHQISPFPPPFLYLYRR